MGFIETIARILKVCLFESKTNLAIISAHLSKERERQLLWVLKKILEAFANK